MWSSEYSNVGKEEIGRPRKEGGRFIQQFFPSVLDTHASPRRMQERMVEKFMRSRRGPTQVKPEKGSRDGTCSEALGCKKQNSCTLWKSWAHRARFSPSQRTKPSKIYHEFRCVCLKTKFTQSLEQDNNLLNQTEKVLLVTAVLSNLSKLQQVTKLKLGFEHHWLKNCYSILASIHKSPCVPEHTENFNSSL